VSTLSDGSRLSIPARRSQSRRFDARLAALAALAVAGLVALAITLAGWFGAPEAPPATGAAALVPADALVYVHLSTDSSRPAVRDASALAARIPGSALVLSALSARLGAILSGPGSTAGFDFAADVRPWLGKEAAFALLNTQSTTAGSLILLDVRNRKRAQSFLASSGARPVREYRGTTELRYRRGTVLAFVSHYLAIGQRASVRSAIDTADGSTPPLRSSRSYDAAVSTEPADRVLDAYVSAAGARRVLGPRGGALGALGGLLAGPGVTGTAISVSAVRGGIRVRFHSALDPSLARTEAAPPSFSPTLASALPAGSSVLLDVDGLARAAPRVLSATAAAGIAPRVGPLLQRLGTALASQGVDVGQALSLFAGETAVAVTPPPRVSAAAAGSGPALVIVARTAHEDLARALIASLEGPLAQLFPTPADGPGQAPEWNDVEVAGVSAHQLAIAPGLELDYAVFRGLVVVSTSLRGIAAIAAHGPPLAGTPAYRAVVGQGPARVTSLLFANFSQLLNLAEQMGLTRGARLSVLRPGLERIRTLGLVSSRGEADTTAELILQIP
jgi:Protein of unknown function (DUF3352)